MVNEGTRDGNKNEAQLVGLTMSSIVVRTSYSFLPLNHFRYAVAVVYARRFYSAFWEAVFRVDATRYPYTIMIKGRVVGQ
jgi:hypothetical protein